MADLTDAQYDRALAYLAAHFPMKEVKADAEAIFALARMLSPDPLRRAFIFALCLKRMDVSAERAGIPRAVLGETLMAVVERMSKEFGADAAGEPS